MPSVHITNLLGAPFEVTDEAGHWTNITELNGRLVRVIHAANNEIVLEPEEGEMSPTSTGGQ